MIELNARPMLSVYVATYNHEKYIEKALDSIFAQKTKYTYEVLIGEDCSTDSTREILKRYEKSHPKYIESGKLTIFYRKTNMYKQRPSNSGDLKKRCRGKYVIALEGDDYWIDDTKIEKQIDFLERHPENIAVAHNCLVVDENSLYKNETYPECKDTEYTLKHFMNNIVPGQLTTVMYRNVYNNFLIDTSLMESGLMPGDRLLYLTLILNGKIYCIQKAMSAYRHITTHGDSFSATHKYSFVEAEKYYKAIMMYMQKFDLREKRYGEILYFRCLMKGLKVRQCTLQKAKFYFNSMKYKGYAIWMWILYKWRKDVMHKRIWM